MPTFYSGRQRKRLQLDRSYRKAAAEDAWSEIRAGAHQFVPGTGFLDAQVMLVGEAPGASEDKYGEPFVGEAGSKLDELLAEARLRRSDVWLTNLVKYRPVDAQGNNRPPTRPEAAIGARWLKREILAIQPALVVLMGHTAYTAMRAAGRLSSDHGRIWLDHGFAFLPTYHPAAALWNPEIEDTIRGDFRLIPDLVTARLAAAELTAADG